MAHQVVIAQPMKEAQTTALRAQLVDDLGSPTPFDVLASMILTLYEKETETIINGREAQDILGVNGGDVDALGNLTLVLTPEDMALVTDPTAAFERHVALLEWTYGDAGAKHGAQEIVFTVLNLAFVP